MENIDPMSIQSRLIEIEQVINEGVDHNTAEKLQGRIAEIAQQLNTFKSESDQKNLEGLRIQVQSLKEKLANMNVSLYRGREFQLQEKFQSILNNILFAADEALSKKEITREDGKIKHKGELLKGKDLRKYSQEYCEFIIDRLKLEKSSPYALKMISKLQNVLENLKWGSKGSSLAESVFNATTAKRLMDLNISTQAHHVSSAVEVSGSGTVSGATIVQAASAIDMAVPKLTAIDRLIKAPFATPSYDKTKSHVVGAAKIRDLITQQDVVVTIISEACKKEGYETYWLVLGDASSWENQPRKAFRELGEDNTIGKVDFGFCSVENNKQYNPNHEEIEMEYIGKNHFTMYGTSNKMFVDHIQSVERENDGTKHSLYKGVGSVLMQAVMERGYQFNCEGRIVLEAGNSSHEFYNKLGLVDRYGNKVDVIEYNGFSRSMRMSDEGIERWAKNINQVPILKKKLPGLHLTKTPS